jgi:hypothetical protein
MIHYPRSLFLTAEISKQFVFAEDYLTDRNFRHAKILERK